MEIDSVSGGIAGEEGKGLGPTSTQQLRSMPRPARNRRPAVPAHPARRIVANRRLRSPHSMARFNSVPSFISRTSGTEARFVKNSNGTLDVESTACSHRRTF